MTEMIVAIAILGLVMGMARMGINWMVALGRQRVLLNAQWNGQVTLYEITRNIRNCRQIVEVSSGTLQLALFIRGPQGFADPTFVVSGTTATVTYDYVRKPQETYLLRTYEYPDPTVVNNPPIIKRESKLLVNMLEEPVNNMWMFQPYGVNVPGKYEAVEVLIRLRPGYWSQQRYAKPIEYRTISMKRTSTVG